MNTKIKKNAVILLYAVCFIFNAVALQTVQTKYFDIIYDAEHSSATAALLVEYADGYADEICTKLNKKMSGRIPVFIMHDTQNLNGYFTPVPYRRITLYDTANTKDDVLANFTDSFLQIFYHELTHAISLDTIVDRYYPLMPLSFSEGIAVSFESLYGQGRINDPLSKHHLIQNKIDGTSPTWHEAAGIRDIHPKGHWPYIYGGYFSHYLQQKYGMEAYSKLWQTSWPFVLYGKFSSIYDVDLKTEWNLFLNTIHTPEILETPVSYPYNLEKSGYTALASCPTGFVYYDFNKNGVYFSSAEKKEPVKLFMADYTVTHLSFSETGQYLTVADEIQKNSKKTIKRLRIFDMHEKKFIGTPQFSIMAACFTDSAAICAIMVKNQEFTAVVLDEKTKKIKKELFKAGPGHQFAALYSPCFVGNNEVAMIAANGTKRTILFINTQTGTVRVLPEETAPNAIRYMQSVKINNEYVLSFSWAEMDMLYRLGLYYPASGLLKLQNTDISGGSFFPIIVPNMFNSSGSKEHTIVYTGMHGLYHRLYTLEEHTLTAKKMGLLPFDPSLATRIVPKKPNLSLLNPKPYTADTWFWHAQITPEISIPNDIEKIGKYGLGFDILMLDPTETVILNPSFSIFPKPFFVNGKVHFSLRFHPFIWELILADRIDSASFRQRNTAVGTGFRLFIPLSYAWEILNIGYNISASLIAPLSNKATSYYMVPHQHTLLRHEATVMYKNIQHSAVSTTPFFAKEKHGIQASLHYLHSYCFEKNAQAAVLEAQVKFALSAAPIVFTTNGYLGFNTYFHPTFERYIQKYDDVSISTNSYLSLFGAYDIPGILYFVAKGKWYGGCSGICDITLFSYDVQKGSSIIPIFCNRFSIHGGYAGLLTNNLLKKVSAISDIYFDTMYINAFMTLNTGMNIGLKYAHPLRIPKRIGDIAFFIGQEL